MKLGSKTIKQGKKNWFLSIGRVISAVMIAFVVIGYFWQPYSPTEMGTAKFSAPSLEHLFGTDNLGRDIFSRVMEGAGTTVFIAICVVLIGAFFGTLIGLVTAYYGGVADMILMRICDTITAFPSILLALVLVTIAGKGKYQIIVILGILFIPSFARVMRSEVARLRHQNYIQAAGLMGASDGRIMFRHIFPNSLSVLLPTLSIGFNNAVLAEASMSYVGVGVQKPETSLGGMLAEAQGYLSNAPWYALSVGLVIVLLILGFSMLGEGLGRKN